MDKREVWRANSINITPFQAYPRTNCIPTVRLEHKLAVGLAVLVAVSCITGHSVSQGCWRHIWPWLQIEGSLSILNEFHWFLWPGASWEDHWHWFLYLNHCHCLKIDDFMAILVNQFSMVEMTTMMLSPHGHFLNCKHWIWVNPMAWRLSSVPVPGILIFESLC